MNIFFLIAGFVVFACLVIAVIAYWIFVWSRSLAALEGWAKKEGYRIVRRSYRSFFRGSFSMLPTTYTVFFVTVHDQDDFERDGWVCCGDQYWGAPGEPEVEWRSKPKKLYINENL